MARSSFVLTIVLLVAQLADAQVNRYFVSFKDKANTTYSVSNPLAFLSAQSLARRANENFVTTEEDFPVNATYVQQVQSAGAQVFYASRWRNGVIVQCDATVINSMSALSCVSSVELVAPGTRLSAPAQVSVVQKSSSPIVQQSVQSLPQFTMLGLDAMTASGYQGSGMNVAVFDAGFIGVNSVPAFQSLMTSGRLKKTYNYVKHTTDVFSDHDHGTEVLSLLTGETGSWTGAASQANYFLFETEDVQSEYRIEEYNWLLAAEYADSAGVDIISSSLGYSTFDDASMNYSLTNLDGKTSVITQAARAATLRGILVVNAAGNYYGSSWPKILVPADAAGVLACASVNVYQTWSSFSLVGPSADGRVKPDVAAQGEGTTVVSSSGNIITANGTSFSTPLIASLATGLRQALVDASAAEIYTRIILSASHTGSPDNYTGYGVPDFSRAFTLTSFQDIAEVYPNPVTDGNAHILFRSPDDQPYSILIFSATGQQMGALAGIASWQNNPVVINLSSAAAGMYFLKVVHSTGSKNFRILKLE